MRTVVILIVFALAAMAQRHKLDEINADKPEGKLLQQVTQENDPAKKAALMEQFASQFPKLAATSWVLEQLEQYYGKANQPDQAMAAGEKLLALDPDDPDAALGCLKAAEAKKDLALVLKYSAITSTNAKKMAAAPQPKDADDAATWKQQVDYAKQVNVYADYALYRAALESRDPKLTIQLADALLQRDPTSEYALKVRQPLFVAYRQSGQNDKALALAEQTLADDQSDEDMLLVVADNYIQNKKEPEKVHAYTAKVVEIMAAKPQPPGVSAADWTAHKNLVVGLAHYMDGKLYYNEQKFGPADQELRKALPLVEGNPVKPEVLYLLGFANYKLEKPQDAANYYRACAAIPGPFQATAAKNLHGIKTEYHGIK
jgi:tetratricopeptide (TPR) repeat protein